MPAFDAHTHLDFPVFDADRDAVCARARNAGVSGWVIAGAAPADWDRVIATAAATGGFAAVGVHPWYLDATADLDASLDRLRTIDGIAAIGETGLDHYRAHSAEARGRQRDVFRAHLDIARSRNLPVVLHIVRAYTEALRILRNDGLPEAGGMIHRFSGKPQQARQAAGMGLHVSFGPALLPDTASKQWEALKWVPVEKLLFETDCPDQPLTGDRGEPADVLTVVDKAASVLRMDPAELGRRTTANALGLFSARVSSPLR